MTNHRVRIYRQRGHRRFNYQKGTKRKNTFPWYALLISGEWQGSTSL
jgi:hypothetical protein